jgi:hypothetical protein
MRREKSDPVNDTAHEAMRLNKRQFSLKTLLLTTLMVAGEEKGSTVHHGNVATFQ